MQRFVHYASLAALAVAAALTAQTVYTFSQGRFFSIDEWQYGHATWLVAQGARPYLDFFEHHFPLSYVLHAPFFWIDWDFRTGALLHIEECLDPV